jgi:tight adherence protein B
MSPMMLTLLTFMAVMLAFGGIYSIAADLFLRDRARVGARVDEEFRKRQRERVERSSLFKNLSQLKSEALTGAAADREEKPTLRERFEMLVEQSGLELTAQQLLSISVGVGLALGIVAGVLRRNPLFGAGGALLGFVVPILYVKFKRGQRLNKLRSQLPDAFDLMARVVRAGQTMAQALLAVSDEFPAPIAAEFSYCYEQQNLGLPPEESYRDLCRRTGLVEIKIFVLGLLVQQQTGGNLAELLDKLSVMLRERFRIKGAISALTAEGRMQAMILMALPPVMFFVIMFLNPEYGRKLFDHPKLIIATLVSEGLGGLWIRKIINFDF